MQHPGEQGAQAPEQVVRLFCERVSLRDRDLLEPLLADDIEFMNVGLEIYRGKSAVLDHFGPDGVWDMFPDRFDFLIRHLAVNGNCVLTERVDVVGVNGHNAPLPLMGIFEVEAGCIRRWRDYADMGMVQRLLRGEVVTPEEGFPPGTDLL